MNNTKNINWNAAEFFKNLTSKNKLAKEKGFSFCRVSGLEGFEEALGKMQTKASFVCVSDIANGYMEINNSPHTRRIKTVFLAMRHKIGDMTARNTCMETMQELFRQFMTKLILEKTHLEENFIYLDSRITFNEIEEYFFSGCACAYFQVAVECYTDLRLNDLEWIEETTSSEDEQGTGNQGA